MTIYEKKAGVGGTWYSNRYPVHESVSGLGSAGQAHVFFPLWASSCLVRYTFAHSTLYTLSWNTPTLIADFKYQFSFEVNASKRLTSPALVFMFLSPSGRPSTPQAPIFVHTWCAWLKNTDSLPTSNFNMNLFTRDMMKRKESDT